MRDKTSRLAIENESPGIDQESGLVPADFKIELLLDSYFVSRGVD
jgi:hypothetical protein